jgi:hypothetical protein
MSIETNEYYYELLNDYHAAPENFVFFTGAGLSTPLFPTWGEFLRQVIDSNKSSFIEQEINELKTDFLDKQEYLNVAEFCINKLGESKYRDILEKIFDIDVPKDDISDSYKSLFVLSPQIIVTTNYDRVPDVLSNGQYRIYTNQNASECLRAIANNKKIIFKIHGDITDHSSIILSSSNYQQIIFSNQNTKQLLQSILSTKKFIFIGFSLSDPHINLILENLKTINNDIPISHYFLLNESSKIKTSMLERQYGVKIIQYSPSEKTHPEVADFLRSLNANQGEHISINPKLDTVINKDDYSEHILNGLKETFDNNLMVSISNNTISLSVTPISQTVTEIQRELLAISKYFKCQCEGIEFLQINLFSNHGTSIDFDKNNALIMSLIVKLDVVQKYINKQITLAVFWDNISFFQSHSLSDPFQTSQKIRFPLNLQVLDLQ